MILDGQAIEYEPGDTVALATLRNGEHPARGGTLCLAGDCGNCVAIVDGTPWVRTCQTSATPGLVVNRHPNGAHPTTAAPVGTGSPEVVRGSTDLVVGALLTNASLAAMDIADGGSAAAPLLQEVESSTTRATSLLRRIGDFADDA